jgi:SWI/SNF-related matrix-associated actin-dependent regulator 1 of chromatin subfamily A
MEVRGIKGKLYDYQKEGIEFLLNSGGRALLADSPGVGKTAQALGYIAHSGHKRSLIVCPASVRYAWESEIEKWTKLKSFVVGPGTVLSNIGADVNCIIVNYDVLKKYFNELMKYRFDCMVGDEVQMIKSEKAIRSKAFKALSRNIPHVIMLTGSPVLSRPIELFNVLNIIDQKTWSNYYSYSVRYCGGKQGYWGFENKGATNLIELKERIERYFLRRTKEEVLPELPPKSFIEIPMDLPTEERKQYDLVEESLVSYMRQYKKEKTTADIAKALAGEKLVKVNLLREINSLGKLDTVRELVDNILDSKEKVLIFSSFNSPLKKLAEEYGENSVMLIGETPINDRGEIIKRFQTDPDTKIFLGGTLSAGTGITLTAASHIIMIDYPWRPGDVDQLTNRAHRPGAVYECLNIYTIISHDSVDQPMKKLLKKKQDIIDQLFTGGEADEDNQMVNDYIASLEHKYGKK